MSTEKVLDAALGLVDREGVAALSMRRLGRELGVEAMTLYYYVPNKDAVLDGLIDRTLSRARVHPEGPWRAWARDFALSFRSALLAHPALLPLLATRPVTTPGGLETVERAARALTDEGFTPTEALHVITTLATFVIGQVLAEAGQTPGHTDPDPALVPDPAHHPTLMRALSAGLGTPADHEDRFTYALDALLTGLRPRDTTP
ncbi:TetR/AcrR family transcriptional regulator C-terminal domain-containing protein [Actinomadura sp. ATCC 31491]|uniref:TetR/AcrR family transcriptional regulator C-terminal domain-containing protein n=1 Tax=Actinomadura luzonensis TaxID=2805427 RepID=A0ABT0FY13_9ACTN|nr:TetR/AcrR family transcriptional regulator C-terminal domain-containing protein [Actinomadura luzonensis]MCK2217154.1 TetR/AcrR family transcriptional regulator C-terminal domain-containing protein [Actinomadura luzonensis]